MKWSSRKTLVLLAAFLVCAIGLSAAHVLRSNNAHVERTLFESNASNLYDTYQEVSASFVDNATSRWNYLQDISFILESNTDGQLDRVQSYLSAMQASRGFTDFFLVDEHGNYCTLDGTKGYIDLGDMLFPLMKDRENIIVDGSLPRKDDMMFYAIPVEPATFNGFSYCALAFGYDKNATADLFTVNAYNQKSNAFVVYTNGRVAMSAKNNTLTLRSLPSFLEQCNVGKDVIARFSEDLTSMASNTMLVKIEGSEYYLHYQPLGIHDWMLVSLTEEAAIGQSTQEIRSITASGLAAVFAMLSGIIVIILGGLLLRANRRRHSEVAKRDRMFEVMAANMDDAYVMLNQKDCTVEYVSPNVLDLFGLNTQEVRADFWVIGKLATEPLSWTNEDLKRLCPGESMSCETGIKNTATGKVKHYRLRVERPKGENAGSLLAVFTDRTADEEAQKQIADALMVAERANKAKTTFLNSMSHDIRTPMNAIIGFASLAASRLDEKHLVKDYLSKIMVSSEHLLSLINDVLDMSRIESGKVKIDEGEASLPSIMHDLRNILQTEIKAKRLNFYIDTVDIVHEGIICDKLRLNQVLINLMSNAMKFTKPGGTVGIRVVERAGAPEGYADFEFRVKDTGIGMSEEFAAHIFEPFTREESSTVSKIQGTGLGMAITKNIVDMMNGSITVNTKEGEGTEFIVAVRLRTSTKNEEIRVIKRLEGFRALVADDSMDCCTSVTTMLRTIGMRPEWTTSGKEAVYRASFAAQEGDPFHVYIIDWLMPDMNGVEVVRRIRQEIGNQVPIIILTAYDWSDIEREALEAGVTAICSKPLFMSELYSVLQNEGSIPEAEVEEVAPFQFEGKRVLLVDDVELNREIAVAILEDAGIEVETAEDGQAAVDLIAGSKGRFDLVLMDIMMPIMDGYEATRAIRGLEDKALASIPIVAMTANAFEEDKKQAMDAGMNDHLAKPFEITKLYEMMRKHL